MDGELEENQKFDNVTLEGLVIKQGQKVLMNLVLETDMSLTQVQALSSRLKYTFKELGLDCEVYSVYTAKFF